MLDLAIICCLWEDQEIKLGFRNIARPKMDLQSSMSRPTQSTSQCVLRKRGLPIRTDFMRRP